MSVGPRRPVRDLVCPTWAHPLWEQTDSTLSKEPEEKSNIKLPLQPEKIGRMSRRGGIRKRVDHTVWPFLSLFRMDTNVKNWCRSLLNLEKVTPSITFSGGRTLFQARKLRWNHYSNLIVKGKKEGHSQTLSLDVVTLSPCRGSWTKKGTRDTRDLEV